MSTKLKQVFIFLLSSFLFTACNKELSFENGELQTGGISGTAVFTLYGSPGTCSDALINGDYNVAIPLGTSNTVTIAVNVTTIGTYTVSTNTINGVSFSGTSSFLSTGDQTITLTGNGTPVASGNFIFTPGVNGCSFTIDFSEAGVITDNYFRSTVDGVATTFNVNLTASSPVVTGFSINGDASVSFNSPTLSIALNNLTGTITTGTYNLLSLAAPSPIFCFPLYDDGSVTWAQATNGQPGTFTVIVTSKTANRINGTFTGTLYDTDGAGAAEKVFTNGEFSVAY